MHGMGQFYNPVGAGVAIAGEISQAPQVVAPSWCTWVPFSGLMSSCQVPTLKQIEAQGVQSLGPAATPETIAATQQAAEQGVQDYCSANPSACAEINQGSEYPITSQVFGTGTAGQIAAAAETAAGQATGVLGTLAQLFTNPTTWWIVGGGAAIYFLTRGNR